MISTATVYSISHAAVRQNIGYTQRFIYGEITQHFDLLCIYSTQEFEEIKLLKSNF